MVNGRYRKGYINKEDLKVVFSLLNENISDEELNSKFTPSWPTAAMIKIAGVKSCDKINFKEFVDFFYKVDWPASSIIMTLSIAISIPSFILVFLAVFYNLS